MPSVPSVPSVPLVPSVPSVPGRFDVSVEHLRSTVSTKWNKFGPDVLGAWIADMDFQVAPPIAEVMQRYVSSGFYGYGVATLKDEMIAAFVDWWSGHGLSADPGRVLLVSELVQAMHACVAAFSSPGDGILVLTPVYPPFFGAVRDQGRTLVEHRLHRQSDSGRYEFDAHALREQVRSARPRVALLCHPHNPVGRVWSSAELQVIADLADELDMLVVSDEIHADLVFAPHRFRSFASLGPTTSNRTVTITSPSKAFNNAGLRCALMHFGSTALLERFTDQIRGDLLGVPSVPGMLTSIAAWCHGREWLGHCVEQLRENRDVVASRLLDAPNGISGPLNEATYLQWLDFSALPGVRVALDADPTICVSDLLRERVGIACNNGPDFGDDLRHFARVNFATSATVLNEICNRIERFAAMHTA
jgi:cysteine-S-conjugate beta-lyase